MKNKILWLIIGLIYLNFGVSNFCNVQGKKTLVIGVDINVPPMGFLDFSGNITGFDIDLAVETFKYIGKEVVFQPIDWDAKELELNSGKIDIIWNGLSYSPERAANMLLTKSYMQNRQVIIVKNYSKISSLNDLNEKSICVQKGSTGAVALKTSNVGKNAKNIVELESIVNCLNEVKLNKSDAAAVDEVVARYYLNKNSMQSDFRILDEELSIEDYVIAVKQGNTELKNEIEKALNQIIESGKGNEISEKWFGKNVINLRKIIDANKFSENENSDIFLELFKGFLITLKLFAVCLTFSIPLGLILCVLRNSQFKFIKILVDMYVWLMQGTPLLLQIFFLFYGLPLLFPAFQANNRFLIGATAFILNYAAYFSEIFRGGAKSIDKGQWEAIQVLQIPKLKAIFKIIIPQAFKVCLPSICNESVTLVKDTALIFSIGVIELLTAAKNSVNINANIAAYVVAAGIYLAICSIINVVFKFLENKLKFE